MSEVLQYRFPDTDGGEPTRARRATRSGNLLIAAMTAVEGGDFEDGIRLMNRILAVRGQVLPVSPTPLTLHARLDRRVGRRRPVADHADAGHRARLDHARTTSQASEDALTAIAEAELIVLGPGSLFTSLLPSLLIPAIRDAVLARDGAAHLRLQRRDPGGRDDRLRPRRPRRGAHRPHGSGPRGHRPGQQPRRRSAGIRGRSRRRTGRCSRGRAGWPPRPVTLRWPPAIDPVPRLILDDVVDPENAASPRSRPARRRAHPGARGRGRDPAPDGRPDRRSGPPDVTRSERDLVTALRDELAAIDPSRAVRSRRRGRRARSRSDRPRGLRGPARPSACGGCGEARRGRPRSTGRRRPTTAGPRGSAAGSSPAARSAWPVAGPTSSSSSTPTTRPELAARLTEFGLPVSWRLRRGRGVVTSKNGEAVGTFLRRIGATGALLEVEARQVSRALRGELNRVLNAESANLQRAVSAAGRQLDAIATLDADGRLADPAVRRPAGGRGAPRDARGEPRRAGRAARDPSLGRAARARATRAPGHARCRTARVRATRLWHDSHDA